MSLSVRHTSPEGEITETKIGYLDLLAATYGIGATVKTSQVFLLIATIAIGCLAFGAAIFVEGQKELLIMLTVGLQSLGYMVSGTARTRYMVETFSKTSTNGYAVYVAAMFASYATAAAAALLMVTQGTFGIIAGIALIVINPLTRYIGDIAFALRIWKSERQERKDLAALEGLRMKDEGLGD